MTTEQIQFFLVKLLNFVLHSISLKTLSYVTGTSKFSEGCFIIYFFSGQVKLILELSDDHSNFPNNVFSVTGRTNKRAVLTHSRIKIFWVLF